MNVFPGNRWISLRSKPYQCRFFNGNFFRCYLSSILPKGHKANGFQVIPRKRTWFLVFSNFFWIVVALRYYHKMIGSDHFSLIILCQIVGSHWIQSCSFVLLVFIQIISKSWNKNKQFVWRPVLYFSLEGYITLYFCYGNHVQWISFLKYSSKIQFEIEHSHFHVLYFFYISNGYS